MKEYWVWHTQILFGFASSSLAEMWTWGFVSLSIESWGNTALIPNAPQVLLKSPQTENPASEKDAGLLKIQTFIYLFAFEMSLSTLGQHNSVNNWATRGCFKWRPGEWQARQGWPGMAQLSGTKWEFALNTERQLNVKTATVHEKANKANSPLLHFELIDRGNNLLYHSPVSLLKSWPWNRWSDEGETRKLTMHRNKQTKNPVQLQIQSLTAHNITKRERNTVCTNIHKRKYKHPKPSGVL